MKNSWADEIVIICVERAIYKWVLSKRLCIPASGMIVSGA